ncbi:MAG: hypothetical protein AAF703_13050 [Cyanobacteria bacterium P01_D01_bin.105]
MASLVLADPVAVSVTLAMTLSDAFGWYARLRFDVCYTIRGYLQSFICTILGSHRCRAG